MDLEVTADFSGLLQAPSFSLVGGEVDKVTDYLSSEAQLKVRYISLEKGTYTLKLEGTKGCELPVIV